MPALPVELHAAAIAEARAARQWYADRSPVYLRATRPTNRNLATSVAPPDVKLLASRSTLRRTRRERQYYL